MNVMPIEALQDNYMYLLIDEASKECAAVDPVEPEKVMDQVKKLGLKLTKVLTTHHHWDHANGNPKLLELLQSQIPVYGGDDRIPALSAKVKHDDLIQLGSLEIRCLFTPCHTTGHICYFVKSAQNAALDPVVFTGDTLFISGCGRFFEGTADQMYTALITILSKLPANTKVYCGHEYTVSNLKYSLFIEPDNLDAKSKLEWAETQRAANQRTIPSTIAQEMTFNPFMRVHAPSIQARLQESDPVKCLKLLRDKKDSWKPT